MHQHERVLVYGEKHEKLMMRAFKANSNEVKQQRLLEEFLDRLPFNVGFYVREKAPKTFKAALEHARKFESICETQQYPQRNSDSITVAEISEVVRKEINQLRDEIEEQEGSNHDLSQGKEYFTRYFLRFMASDSVQRTEACDKQGCQTGHNVKSRSRDFTSLRHP